MKSKNGSGGDSEGLAGQSPINLVNKEVLKKINLQQQGE
jgi:hypothetical protein